MEGPSSRLPANQDGALCPAGRRDSGVDAECDPARDIKTHFRVCRFIMETGNPPGLCVVVVVYCGSSFLPDKEELIMIIV